MRMLSIVLDILDIKKREDVTVKMLDYVKRQKICKSMMMKETNFATDSKMVCPSRRTSFLSPLIRSSVLAHFFIRTNQTNTSQQTP